MTEKYTPTKAQRGRPQGQNAMVEVVDGENRETISFSRMIMELPRINLYNPEEVMKRSCEYMDLCEKYDRRMLVTEYAACLHMTKQQLWELRTGKGYQISVKYRLEHMPEESLQIIRDTYNVIEANFESFMINGKINPVVGIFYAKNHFGYQDKVDINVDNTTGELSEEELAKRYVLEYQEEEKASE